MTDKTNVLLIYFLQYDSIILVGISIGVILYFYKKTLLAKTTSTTSRTIRFIFFIIK